MQVSTVQTASAPSWMAHPSAWCTSHTKRLFDCVFASLLLLSATPLMVLIAALVALDSRGPVLFRQARVGQFGAEFELIKFRSMQHGSQQGPQVTAPNDGRITRIGRILRWSKLDELPQLWNVLGGDMSIVGPRPDLAEFITTLKPELRAITDLRPGLTSLASIRFRHEEAVLAEAGQGNLIEYYIDVVLPEKVSIDLAYARHATFCSDLNVILKTVLRLCD